MLKRALSHTKSKDITILPAETHNPNAEEECEECLTRHLLTGCWGTDGECDGSERSNEIIKNVLKEGYRGCEGGRCNEEDGGWLTCWVWGIFVLVIFLFLIVIYAV
jgi:hypothetical protein